MCIGELMNSEKLKMLIPMESLEHSAQQQIYDNLKLPFLEKLAIMPDCHPGYLLPIGGVALLDKVISPEYIGYDIGCGICTLITDSNAKEILKDDKIKDKIFQNIYKEIPVGRNMRNEYYIYPEFKSASSNKDLNKKVNERLYKQLGTLGGGNHFIEIGEDKEGKLAFTIHSGSRNPGHSVAGYYMKKTKLNDMDLPKGFFHIDSEWGEMYYEDMKFMLLYALQNRKIMMKTILDLFGFDVSKSKVNSLSNMINENHNHGIKLDNNKILHRKGATESKKDQLGVIPGNMRDGVYIVKGLGNEEFLSSSSHGAGRKGSRKWAKSTLSIDKFKDTMKNITAKVNEQTLDESPDAYKNINDVIKAQDGIVVDVINHIKPIINIKA